MKIGDVKVGEEYGVLESPRGSGYGRSRTPRHMKVLEVVEQAEQTYNRYTSGVGTKKVRRLKVEFLDAGRESYYDKIESAAKGSVLAIEARQCVALWADIRDDIKAIHDLARKRDETEGALEKRIEALLGKTASRRGEWYVTVTTRQAAVETVAHFSDKTLDKLLALAEAGKS